MTLGSLDGLDVLDIYGWFGYFGQRRKDQAALITPHRLAEILELALPTHTLRSFELLGGETLGGGSSNLNYLLRFHGTHAPVVLRIYLRDPLACRREVEILCACSGRLPVPEIVYANPHGHEDLAPFILYPFVEGVTFQELKAAGNLQYQYDAAYAIGFALAQVGKVVLPPSLCAHLAPRPQPTKESSHSPFLGSPILDSPFLDSPILDSPSLDSPLLHSPILQGRMGEEDTDRLRAFICLWLPRIHQLYRHAALVHGDFNNRNTILRQEGDRWRVAAILDWETAFLGSPLWDAARFICYERPGQPLREPHFSRGFLDGGGTLPDDWSAFSRVVNAVSAAESLCRRDLPARFIPELHELVMATVGRIPS